MPSLDNPLIGIIGLCYVGLPLAVEFSKQKPSVGLDLKPGRIAELRRHVDVTREVRPPVRMLPARVTRGTVEATTRHERNFSFAGGDEIRCAAQWQATEEPNR